MHKPFIPLPLVIVAGGKSSRMGSDKALLPFSTSKTLTEYQLTRLAPHFQSIHVSAKNRAKFHFDASFIEDTKEYQEHSPLVALLSILEYFQIPVAILSVDTPFVTPEVFETLLSHLNDSVDVVVATSPSTSHQLCAIYSPAIIPVIRTKVNKNIHKVRSVLEECRVAYVPFENEQLFFNVNRPEDYEEAKQQL